MKYSFFEGKKLKRGNVHYLLFIGFMNIIVPSVVFGYTANSIKLEMMEKGGYRVYINYTIPEIQEFREAFVEFRSKKEADDFYNEILQGADFFLKDPEKNRFSPTPKGPRPW